MTAKRGTRCTRNPKFKLSARLGRLGLTRQSRFPIAILVTQVPWTNRSIWRHSPPPDIAITARPRGGERQPPSIGGEPVPSPWPRVGRAILAAHSYLPADQSYWTCSIKPPKGIVLKGTAQPDRLGRSISHLVSLICATGGAQDQLQLLAGSDRHYGRGRNPGPAHHGRTGAIRTELDRRADPRPIQVKYRMRLQSNGKTCNNTSASQERTKEKESDQQ